MKTKDLPAIVMLLAGGVYCVIGIIYRIPLFDFVLHLLIILILFWIIGGILRWILDCFLKKLGDKTETEDKEELVDKDASEKNQESNEVSTDADKGLEKEE